jgi:hypothetical protein
MATMRREKNRLTNVTDLRTALMELFRKRLKSRFSARAAYRLCELWSMDRPPDTLEETGMANRLDDLVGFHLSEEELIIAYDLDDLQASAIYLYNLAKKQERRPYPSDA